jgi:hypothetical protein
MNASWVHQSDARPHTNNVMGGKIRLKRLLATYNKGLSWPSAYNPVTFTSEGFLRKLCSVYQNITKPTATEIQHISTETLFRVLHNFICKKFANCKDIAYST